MKSRYLYVSDLQVPYEARHALRFCLAVQKEFNIPSENIYCVGDEVDQYFGSLYQKSVDGQYTAAQEIKASHQKLKAWYRAFPSMKIATSNHGMRWAKKASAAEIPSQMLKAYQEVLQAPKGWVWKDAWVINAGKARIKMIHGLGFSGVYAHRHAAIDHGMNIVMGHLHTNAGVSWVETAGKSCWGLATGCLIDVESYAFEYGKYNRNKPVLGVGVVIDGGTTPLFVPYEANL